MEVALNRAKKSAKKLFSPKVDDAKKLVDLDDAALKEVSGGGQNCGGIGIPNV